MKTLLFDENASETNNNFHEGFNVTVRRGTKYSKELEIGEVVNLKNLQTEKLGEGTIIQWITGPIEYIPMDILEFEHDPKCRNMGGLIEVLQNCYDDPSIDLTEIVTAIVFKSNFTRGYSMDIDKLRRQLEIDEGCMRQIYRDHLGYPTFGIGHLILKTDPEYGQAFGTPVLYERVREAFESDVSTVLSDCVKLYSDFYDLPEEAQQIIANMMFNMGRTRLSKFKNMKKAVDARKWSTAAAEMIDSSWYRQVTNRADRLVKRMRKII
jgi:GH24 family phage-related lysozyme (muramidase)